MRLIKKRIDRCPSIFPIVGGLKISKGSPRRYGEAMKRKGPFHHTDPKVWAILDVERAELINGWLVWKHGTEYDREEFFKKRKRGYFIGSNLFFYLNWVKGKRKL